MGLHTLALAGFAILVVAYLWFIDAYAVNTIWVDQWSDLGLIDHAYSGHLTLSVLWTQHTDNRILFPNLVVLLLAKTTHFNVIDEEFISAFTLIAATVLLIIGHRRHSPGTPWILYLPVRDLDALVRAERQHAVGLPVRLVSGPPCSERVLGALRRSAMELVPRRRGDRRCCGGQLLIAAGPLDMAELPRRPLAQTSKPALRDLVGRRRSRHDAIYFVNFNTKLGASDHYALHHPAKDLRFFFFSVGDVIGAHGGDLAVALGVLIVFTALWLTFWAVVRAEDNDGALLGVGLICFGLLFAVTITAGRVSAGLDAGGASRYTTFDLLTLVGCYFVLLARRGAAATDRRLDKVLWWTSRGIVGAGVSLTLVLGTINGLDDASSWQSAQIRAARTVANIQGASDSMVERVLNVNPYYVPDTRHLAAFARQDHLSLRESIDRRSLSTRRTSVRRELTHDHRRDTPRRCEREGCRGSRRVCSKRLRCRDGGL